MKKTLIAFAALSAIAGMAQAQSTVTIYGILDANIQSLKTNVLVPAAVAPAVLPASASVQRLTQPRIDSAGLNGSRWGIRVSEDLGGGLAAVGNLESGFDISTGITGQAQAGGQTLFGRRANVGVTSNSFGTVTLGRNSTSYDDVTSDHAMMGGSIFDPSYNFVSFSQAQVQALGSVATATVPGAAPFVGNRPGVWLGYNQRMNNSVKYISPNFSGFSGSAIYAFGEDKTTAVGASRSVGANLKYANGPLLVSGGYQSDGFARGGAAGDKPTLENAVLSVAYDFGVAKVGAGFNRAKFKDVTPTTSLAPQNEFNLSVAVPLGATTLSAGYARSKGDDLGVSSGFGVQALYSLSKRTTLYAGLQTSKAYDKVANRVTSLAPTSNVGRTELYAAGIRHTF